MGEKMSKPRVTDGTENDQLIARLREMANMPNHHRNDKRTWALAADVIEIRAHALRDARAERDAALEALKWSGNLIRQLPKTHDGRNTWLMNWGDPNSPDVLELRSKWEQRTGRSGNWLNHALVERVVEGEDSGA